MHVRCDYFFDAFLFLRPLMKADNVELKELSACVNVLHHKIQSKVAIVTNRVLRFFLFMPKNWHRGSRHCTLDYLIFGLLFIV